MACNVNWLCAIAILLLASTVQSQAQNSAGNKNTAKPPPATNDPNAGNIVAEEVVVESSLNVRPAHLPPNRRVRNVIYYLVPDVALSPSLVREKRQYQPGFGFGSPNSIYPQNAFYRPNNYDSSQSTAQSNSHSHAFGPYGSQNADALAAAQGFQSSGPLGSFGATANNANTQTLDIGPQGAQGGFSNAGGQTYNLPNGQSLNIAYNNGVSYQPNGRPSVSQGSSIAFGG